MPKKLIVLLSLLCACSLALADDSYVEQLRKKAEAGDAEAQHNMGWMHLKGDGVPEDDKEAIKWYRLAADQGHAGAQYNLGNMYSYPQGVPQDYKEAVKWYRLAADQGFVMAQVILGWMYEEGKGVPQDYVQAYAWYNLAGGEIDLDSAKADLAKQMTPEQIARAQELSTELYKKINAAK